MGAINYLGNRFPLPDNLSQDFAIPYALSGTPIAVGVGDAMYFAGQVAIYGDVAYPADQLPTLGTEALDQIQFAKLFVGYTPGQILLTETNKFKRLMIRTNGPAICKCPSQTWKHGDLVGIYSNGVTIDPQQVDKVTQRALAIGVCIKDSVNPATTVTFDFESRYADGIMDVMQYASQGEQQSMNAVNVLTDANQIFTVASPQFNQMTNSSARTIKLPLESASGKLIFMIHNMAASAGSITFLGSAGGNALGTAVIPAGKFGQAFCDGATWYSLISA